jgi:hypothetical protein
MFKPSSSLSSYMYLNTVLRGVFPLQYLADNGTKRSSTLSHQYPFSFYSSWVSEQEVLCLNYCDVSEIACPLVSRRSKV